MNKKKFENNKKIIQSWVSHEYPGVRISWNGEDPAIIIPDELIPAKEEIVSYVQAAVVFWGGSVKFEAG